MSDHVSFDILTFLAEIFPTSYLMIIKYRLLLSHMQGLDVWSCTFPDIVMKFLHFRKKVLTTVYCYLNQN